jgi:polyphosphate kinase
LKTYLRDNVNARELRSDGTYCRVKSQDGEKKCDSQLEFESAAYPR